MIFPELQNQHIYNIIHNMKNLRPSVQYEFSKNISRAVDHSSGFVYAAYGCVFIFSSIYLGCFDRQEEA